MDSDLRKKLAAAFRARRDSGKKGIFYGGMEYSYQDLATEIENDSPVGRAHCNMLEDLAARLGISIEDLIEDIAAKEEESAARQVGDRMDDGTVYAGSLKGKDLYTTPEDAPLTYTFNEAANHAAKLNREKYLGHADWRVPTKDELSSLFNDRAAIGGFKLDGPRSGSWYWSGSAHNGWQSWGQLFSYGCRHYFSNDHYLLSVRCVRG